MIAAVCVLQAALFIFMRVEVFSAMIVARFLQGAASSVVFSGESFSSMVKGSELIDPVGFALMYAFLRFDLRGENLYLDVRMCLRRTSVDKSDSPCLAPPSVYSL